MVIVMVGVMVKVVSVKSMVRCWVRVSLGSGLALG